MNVTADALTSALAHSIWQDYFTGVENPPKCPIGDCEYVGDRAESTRHGGRTVPLR